VLYNHITPIIGYWSWPLTCDANGAVAVGLQPSKFPFLTPTCNKIVFLPWKIQWSWQDFNIWPLDPNASILPLNHCPLRPQQINVLFFGFFAPHLQFLEKKYFYFFFYRPYLIFLRWVKKKFGMKQKCVFCCKNCKTCSYLGFCTTKTKQQLCNPSK